MRLTAHVQNLSMHKNGGNLKIKRCAGYSPLMAMMTSENFLYEYILLFCKPCGLCCVSTIVLQIDLQLVIVLQFAMLCQHNRSTN